MFFGSCRSPPPNAVCLQTWLKIKQSGPGLFFLINFVISKNGRIFPPKISKIGRIFTRKPKTSELFCQKQRHNLLEIKALVRMATCGGANVFWVGAGREGGCLLNFKI
jgi:hypothetical protein